MGARETQPKRGPGSASKPRVRTLVRTRGALLHIERKGTNPALLDAMARQYILALVAVGWACGSTTSTEDPLQMPTETSGPTWSSTIRDVVARNCASCHLAGGIGPFPMDTYESASAIATAALAAIEADRMPPWMPSADCRTYQDERRMPTADKEAFRAWVAAGTPEGSPTEPITASTETTRPTPDIVAAPTGPYVPAPATGNPDDYRCFLLDATFATDTFVEQAWVVPGVPAIVHHVLLYAIGANDAAQAEQQEGADGQAGFDCFGAMTGGPIGWWVPGAVPQSYPGRAAKVIPAGSRILMQVHYNVLAADAAPDTTEYHLVTRAAPEFAAVTTGLGNRAIEIPPGAPQSEHVRSFRNTGTTDWVISEVMGHMHLLGTRITVEAVRANGETECLLDIPAWDFDWQQAYRLPESTPLRVGPGESLRLTCTYDNTLANQPVIDGERAEPRLVRWGEGSLDEMCLAYVTRELPLPEETNLPDACSGLAECRAGCADPDSYLCLLDCSFRRSSCGGCLVQEMYSGGCGSQACGAEAQAITDCFANCRRDSTQSIEACLRAACPAETGALDACMTPVVSAGACEGALTVCGG